MNNPADKFDLEILSDRFLEVLKTVEISNLHLEEATRKKRKDEITTLKKNKKEQIEQLLEILSKFDVHLELNEAAL